MDKLFIVMPAYNEEENIAAVVGSWAEVSEKVERSGVECCIVVANDGSKDNTSGILHDLENRIKSLVVLDKKNTGHGPTLLFLYDFAISNGSTFVFQTDSDGQTDPAQFYEMWIHREEYDFQIGTRGKRKDGFSRIVVTKVLKLVVRIIFGVWVKDANTPFRLMKTDKLSEVLGYIPSEFFLTNVAVSAIAVRKSYSTRWYPITFLPRSGGVNSINIKKIFRIGWDSLADLSSVRKNLK